MPFEKQKLRGLVIAPFGIVPAVEGNQVHAEAHIRQLKELGHDIWYLAAGIDPVEAEAMKQEWNDRFVHTSARRPPLFRRLLRGLRRRSRVRLGHPPHLDYWFLSAWLEKARDLVARVDFDYVIVHYIFYTRFFEILPPSVRKIIDTHDSFANLEAKLSAKGVDYAWLHCSPADEIKGLRRGDIVMANQAEEAALFEHCLQGARKVVTVGHPSEWNPLSEPAQLSVGFLASDNPQNQAGLTWFIEQCWPSVLRAIPDMQLLIAGLICDSPGPWHPAPGVRIIGRVNDVCDFHKLTTVEINPVSAGSGLKIKTVDSLAAGRALVTVSEGVAGLSRDFDAFVIEDEPDQFAAAIIRLLQNPDERAGLTANAQRLLRVWNDRQLASLKSLFTDCERSAS